MPDLLLTSKCVHLVDSLLVVLYNLHTDTKKGIIWWPILYRNIIENDQYINIVHQAE